MSTLATSPPAACRARSTSLACSTPMMLSGEPRHSGSRVTPAASTASISSRGGSSASSMTILVRWTMTSETVSSRRSSRPPIMSRSSFSTTPARCIRSTAPRNSSRGVRIDWILPSGMPTARRMSRTSHSTAAEIGRSTVHRALDRLGDGERDAIGRVERHRLRQHFGTARRSAPSSRWWRRSRRPGRRMPAAGRSPASKPRYW